MERSRQAWDEITGIMSTEEAPENELETDAADPAELDEAIDGLRDVLKQDAEGTNLSGDEAEAGELPDIGSDFGGDIGSDFAADGDLGADFSADGGLGDDLATGDLGSDFGGSDFGGDDFGGGGLSDDLSAGGDFGGASFDAGASDLSAGGGINDLGAGGAAATGATGSKTRADLILDIPIDVQVVLGTSRMQVSALMDLNEGATIGLERKIGEPVEIMVNGRLIGRGEITVLENDDTRFGVKMIEVIGSKPNTG